MIKTRKFSRSFAASLFSLLWVFAQAEVYASTCVDTDGDGWGWRDHASCVVGVSPQELPTPIDTTCEDHDGDGWGWNGQGSCQLLDSTPIAVVALPAREGLVLGVPMLGDLICEDHDGDGWGWNSQGSCEMAELSASVESASNTGNYTPEDITDLILITGQSNALGSSITTYDANLDRVNDRVFAFTDQGWQVADLHQIWDRDWHPRNDPNTDPTNNFGLHFGKKLVEFEPNRVVGFILATAPGMAISHWSIEGDFYTEVSNKAIDAINQLPHKHAIDGVLWHQGESDANYVSSYSYKLNQLIENLRLESWLESKTPFICGEIAKATGINQELNRLNEDNDSFTGCVHATDLPTGIYGTHFLSESLRTLGQRYATRYFEMTR